MKEFTDADKSIDSVETRLAEYESLDGELLNKVDNLLKLKGENWDRTVPNSNADITKMLMFEYLYGVREIARNQAKETTTSSTLEEVNEQELMESVYIKLEKTLDTFRLGGLKPEDGEILYGCALDDKNAIIVGSDEYERNVRQKGMGACNLFHVKNGDLVDTIVLYENGMPSITGNAKLPDVTKLEGENFADLMELRQIVFHELTHVMERCDIKGDEIPEVIKMNGAEYENYENAGSYIAVENGVKVLKTLATPIKSSIGLETVERGTDGKITHNQITEGAVEHSARTIMRALKIPEKYIAKKAYNNNVIMFEEATKEYGNARTVANFLTRSYEVKKALESRTHSDSTLLADMSKFVEESQLYYEENGERHYIDKDLENAANKAVMEGRASSEEIEAVRKNEFWSMDRNDEGYEEKFAEVLQKARAIDADGVFEKALTEYKKINLRDRARNIVEKYKPKTISLQESVTSALSGANMATLSSTHEAMTNENNQKETTINGHMEETPKI